MVLSRTFTWDDFYFTGGDYRLRIKPPLLDRYAEPLREQFNSGVRYGGKRVTWDTLILRKCQELARYLLGKATQFDLVNPNPTLDREDTQVLRKKIQSLSGAQATGLGFNKSTLHYLRKRARDRKPFRIYEPVMAKLEE